MSRSNRGICSVKIELDDEQKLGLQSVVEQHWSSDKNSQLTYENKDSQLPSSSSISDTFNNVDAKPNVSHLHAVDQIYHWQDNILFEITELAEVKPEPLDTSIEHNLHRRTDRIQIDSNSMSYATALQSFVTKEEEQIEEQNFSVVQPDEDIILTDSSASDDDQEEFSTKEHAYLDKFIVYFCPQCDALCGTLKDWRFHTESEHKFDTIEALSIQTITEETKKSFHQCCYCLQKFPLGCHFSRLLYHSITHMPSPQCIMCKICNKMLLRKNCAKRHMLNYHIDLCRPYLESNTYNNVMEYIKITCPICFALQISMKHWLKHMKTHDYLAKCYAQSTKVSNDLFECSMCQARIRSGTLREHMLAHEPHKSFACINCNNYGSNRLRQTIRHVRHKHLVGRSDLIFKCIYCDEAFKKESQRIAHYRSKHNVTFQKCPVCDKEFVGISLLTAHMNRANHHSADDWNVYNEKRPTGDRRRLVNRNKEKCVKPPKTTKKYKSRRQKKTLGITPEEPKKHETA